MLLLLPVTVHAANRIELSGVTGERKQNVELYLSSIASSEINPSARFKNRVNRDIKLALRALGYYQVVVDFEDIDKGKDYVLHAKITANKYVYIDINDIRIIGGAANDTQFLQLLKNAAPKKGERLHHGKYENYKSELMSLANRKGFFDAKFERTELIVTPGDRRGTVKLFFNSGVRYKFGDITFHGSQINRQRLRSLLTFRKGDHYSARLLGELSQALSTTNWFSSINLEADVENRQNGVLPLRVELTPALRNVVEAGIGYATYSTDAGVRLKGKWDKPWLNDRGHSLSSELALSSPEQKIETRYKLPLRNVTNDFYQFTASYTKLDDLDTNSQKINLVAERNWLLKSGWNRTLSMRGLYENFIQGNQDDQSVLFMPGISYSRGTNSGGNMPETADFYSLTVEVANKALASDTDFIRLRGRAGLIGSWSADERWLVRVDGGVILQEQVLNIPPSLRFYAGGDNSLRGFGYQKASPLDESNLILGGTRLATINLEYQHRLKDDWWLALFTDYGSAWNTNPDWQQSVGFGARWASPVGPLRIDLAFPINNDQQNGVRLHFTLGPEL
ncbi:MAG: autotransporter assembly complex protein TamA [Gammaproteobacteria bacterium]|nr:autotransporter assembly complex protein TamA [Gammaproteobacteria bacterium]